MAKAMYPIYKKGFLAALRQIVNEEEFAEVEVLLEQRLAVCPSLVSGPEVELYAWRQNPYPKQKNGH